MNRYIGLVCCVVSLLCCVGCKTPSSLSSTGESIDPAFNIFYDQGDHLKDLIGKKEFKKAAILIQQNEEYFNKRKDKYKDDILTVANFLNTSFKDRVLSATIILNKYSSAILESQWHDMRKNMHEAENIISEYNSNRLLSMSEYRMKEIVQLINTKNELLARLQIEADKAFLIFDHFSGTSFIEAYPGELPNKFISQHFKAIAERLSAASSNQLQSFLRTYGASDVELPSDIKNKKMLNISEYRLLSNLYIDSLIRELQIKGKVDIASILKCIADAKAKGFSPDKITTIKLKFIDISNREISGEGQIDFAIDLYNDTLFELVTGNANNLTNLLENDNSSFYVLIDVTSAQVNRSAKDRQKVSSNYLAGYRREGNPQYEIARLRLNEAEQSYNDLSNQHCYGNIGCSLKAAALIASAGVVGKAKNAFANTPMYIDVPVYQDYTYNFSNIDAMKDIKLSYYVVDRKSMTMTKSLYGESTKKGFKVAYNIHEKDTSNNRFDTEKDVAKFEKEITKIGLSDLLSHYNKESLNLQVITSFAEVQNLVKRDKDILLSDYKAKKYGSTIKDDKRFESIVVIKNPKGSLGAGFFVQRDMVITNYHVVEGANYIEIKNFAGQESLGKVIKTDARLDLAIVKTQINGVPLQFCSENFIPIGAKVVAIGHPQGYEYTLTQGIVSAVRFNKSALDIGGKDILFVQTDTAINPGNSGGPLLLGDRVIGINNNKLVSTSVEGIGFAIHYSEIANFLNANQ